MAFDRTYYQCPICGKGCTGAIAFRKHYESCKKKHENESNNTRTGKAAE